ncbi:hypothetical protein [Sphingopyxis sp. BSNA05]|uniref:hypothetical protein n=1 Tax=Sphingopyxis sp. BSNA05 TaxID=1236614 RepID=UPI00156497F6|nr:hypothetical protein [Sphingopyxis sp. BSNA05]
MTLPDETTETYEVREVVSRFTNATEFEDAVEAVENHGIDRADISMIASHDAVQKKLGHHYSSLSQIEEDGSVPQTYLPLATTLRKAKRRPLVCRHISAAPVQALQS